MFTTTIRNILARVGAALDEPPELLAAQRVERTRTQRHGARRVVDGVAHAAVVLLRQLEQKGQHGQQAALRGHL